MGWRDRDYAKWTDAERRRFYGSSRRSNYAARSSYSVPGQGRFFGSRVRPLPGAFLAVIVSCLVALMFGQLPRSHPLIPALHFTLHPIGSVGARTGTISLPRSLHYGSFLSLHGQLPSGETGTVTVEGAYDKAPMQVLATAAVQSGYYDARIPLTQRGFLHLRVTYPDGHQALGEASVG